MSYPPADFVESLSNPRLHHVGIVLPTEKRALEFMELLGLSEAYRGFVDQYQALCIFTEGKGASPIELVIPRGGVLSKFNQGVGGVHHIGLAVENLRVLEQQLRTKGIPLLESEPVQGAGPFICNFLSPVYTRGVLVEFIEEIEGQ